MYKTLISFNLFIIFISFKRWLAFSYLIMPDYMGLWHMKTANRQNQGAEWYSTRWKVLVKSITSDQVSNLQRSARHKFKSDSLTAWAIGSLTFFKLSTLYHVYEYSRLYDAIKDSGFISGPPLTQVVIPLGVSLTFPGFRVAILFRMVLLLVRGCNSWGVISIFHSWNIIVQEAFILHSLSWVHMSHLKVIFHKWHININKLK